MILQLDVDIGSVTMIAQIRRDIMQMWNKSMHFKFQTQSGS